MDHYLIKKALNNNVIICSIEDQEVILIGKGIGFNKKPGMYVKQPQSIEKVYKLVEQSHLNHYKTLVSMTDDYTLQAIIEAVNIITNSKLIIDDEKLVVSLTDHIIFAYKRIQQQQYITNPFVSEIKHLFNAAYIIAERVIVRLNEALNITFPEDEIGFIALHIASNTEMLSLREMTLINELINKATFIIEHDLQFEIDRQSLKYQRFIRHIHFLIRRIQLNERERCSHIVDELLKSHYSLCYNIALKVMRMLQQELDNKIYESEIVFLTLHIYHFMHHSDSK